MVKKLSEDNIKFCYVMLRYVIPGPNYFEVDGPQFGEFRNSDFVRQKCMYLMTGRKWEWRLTVVDYKSNEP